MDTHDYLRVASVVSAERSAVGTALAVFRHSEGDLNWRGPSRVEANAARVAAQDACALAVGALDDAERQLLRLWRESLASQQFLGG